MAVGAHAGSLRPGARRAARIVCANIKVEGLLWALTLLPAALTAWNRRAGLALVAAVALAGVGWFLFGPERLELFGYVLRTRVTNVSLPLAQHLFVMDNWHLLWYGALLVVAWRWRRLLPPGLAPMTVTLAGGLGIVFVVFFMTSAAGGVDDESLVNRLPLHMVPALCFYLALLVGDWSSPRASQAQPYAAAE